MIECSDYDYDQVMLIEDLFSPQVASDPWVLYHATSSLAELEIESTGFAGKASSVTAEQVIQLVTLYRRINWTGIHSDGYAALATFTFGRNRYPSPHTWFRETSMRSLVYAQRSWAGGEWVMSFRQAFADVLEFLVSKEIQATHLQEQVDTCKALVERDGALSRVIKVDVEGLAAGLDALRPVFETCTRGVHEYKYGVVYAVRLSEDDAFHLSDEGSAGILYSGTLPPDRIAAKARLHLGDLPAPRKRDKVERLLSWNSSDLARRIRKNRTGKQELTKQASVYDLRPEWLGDDISLQIARDYGSKAVQEMLMSRKIHYND